MCCCLPIYPELSEKTAHPIFNTDKSTFSIDSQQRLWKVHTEPEKNEIDYIFRHNVLVCNLPPHSRLLTPTSMIRQNDHTIILCMPLGKTDLFNIIKEPFDWEFLRGELVELALVIQYLHENDVAHRDIKPENVVLYKGQLCLIDFDFAGHLTQKMHCGTVLFKCPESMSESWTCSDSDFSRRNDVYAFGKLVMAVLWQAAAHKMINNRDFIFDAFHADFLEEMTQPFSGTWGEWCTVAVHCLSKNPPSTIPLHLMTKPHM